MFFSSAVKPESKILTEVQEIPVEVEDVTAYIHYIRDGFPREISKEFAGAAYYNPTFVEVYDGEVHHNGVTICTGEDRFKCFMREWAISKYTLLGNLSIPFCKHEYAVLTRIKRTVMCKATVIIGE